MSKHPFLISIIFIYIYILHNLIYLIFNDFIIKMNAEI